MSNIQFHFGCSPRQQTYESFSDRVPLQQDPLFQTCWPNRTPETCNGKSHCRWCKEAEVCRYKRVRCPKTKPKDPNSLEVDDKPIDRAFSYKNTDLVHEDYSSLISRIKPFKVTPLLDFSSSIRVDSRPLNQTWYAPSVLKGTRALPASMILNGEKFTITSSPQAVLPYTCDGCLDVFGVNGVRGDLESAFHVILHPDDVARNPNAVQALVPRMKKVIETLQDDLYKLSEGMVRLKKVYASVYTINTTNGTITNPNGSLAPYNILDCEPTKGIIATANWYVANHFGWDQEKFKQNIFYPINVAYRNCSSSYAGQASTGCDMSECGVHMNSGAFPYDLESGLVNPKGFQLTLLHEVLHNMGLFHSSIQDSNTMVPTNVANKRLTSIHRLGLGWMPHNNVQIINLETITLTGSVFTVSPWPLACTILALPVIVCNPINKTYCSMPYPVYCLDVYKGVNVVINAWKMEHADNASKARLIFPFSQYVTDVSLSTDPEAVRTRILQDQAFIPTYAVSGKMTSFPDTHADYVLKELGLPSNNKRPALKIKIEAIKATSDGILINISKV